jgi:hypothetical protein
MIYLNGINPKTGEYLVPPVEADDLLDLVAGSDQGDQTGFQSYLHTARAWTDSFAKTLPRPISLIGSEPGLHSYFSQPPTDSGLTWQMKTKPGTRALCFVRERVNTVLSPLMISFPPPI